MVHAELKTRLLLGSAMAATVTGVYIADATWFGGILTAVLLGLIAVFAVWEYVTMMRQSGHAIAAGMLLAVTVLLAGSALLFRGWQHVDRELYPLAIGTFVLLFPIALRSLAADRMRRGLEAQGATLLGFVWIAWPLFFAQGMAIRHLPSVLYVVAICKVGDVGAYFAGVTFGRHKLIPHISKGKTIEGAVGSVVASCAVAVWLKGPLTPAEAGVGLTAAIGIGIILNLAAQIGDLVESLLKRNCGVKDSSSMLPAHGGVLDLIDSLLFSFPVYFFILVGLTENPP